MQYIRQPKKGLEMIFFKFLILFYTPTTLYVSFYHANSIAMFYIVHKYQKKFESTNMDLTHLYFLILIGFPVKGYGCSTIHKIVPCTSSFKLMTVFGHRWYGTKK